MAGLTRATRAAVVLRHSQGMEGLADYCLFAMRPSAAFWGQYVAVRWLYQQPKEQG